MKYRKKPVVIEAYKFQTELGIARLANWLSLHKVDIAGWTFHDTDVTIPTLEGDMKATRGDYIIIGVHGEVYPCKPDIFLETYEEVTDLAALSRKPPKSHTKSAQLTEATQERKENNG